MNSVLIPSCHHKFQIGRNLRHQHLKQSIVTEIVLAVITTEQDAQLPPAAKRVHQQSTVDLTIIQVFNRYGETHH